MRIVVDLSSGIDLYPTLRLIDNLHEDYTNSMAAIQDVLGKMEALGATDLILSLHRYPENNFSDEQTRAAFTATLKALAGQAAERGVTLHLRVGFGKPPWSLAEGFEWLDRVGAPNLKLAVCTALLEQKPPAAEAAARLKDKLGLWLVAASRKDVAGKMWDAHGPIHPASSHGASGAAVGAFTRHAGCPGCALRRSGRGVPGCSVVGKGPGRKRPFCLAIKPRDRPIQG